MKYTYLCVTAFFMLSLACLPAFSQTQKKLVYENIKLVSAGKELQSTDEISLSEKILEIKFDSESLYKVEWKVSLMGIKGGTPIVITGTGNSINLARLVSARAGLFLMVETKVASLDPNIIVKIKNPAFKIYLK